MPANPLANIPVTQLQEVHITALVTLSTTEGQDLEFKRTLALNSQSDKREFCKDVSAFANSGGGYILYGIDEQNGRAGAVVGIDLPAKNDETIRQVITSAVAPHLQAFQIHAVLLASGKHVLVLAVESDGFLHQVKYDDNRFYKRVGNITVVMDPADIATFFAPSTASTREDRVCEERNAFENSIKGRAFHDLAYDSGILAMSIIPLNDQQVLPVFDNARRLVTSLKPIYCSGWDMQYHQHSVTTFSGKGRGAGRYAVLELAENGKLCSANSFILSIEGHRPFRANGQDQGMIPSVAYERELIEAGHNYFYVLRELGATPPWSVGISLLNVRGYVFAVAPLVDINDSHVYHHDDVKTHPVLVATHNDVDHPDKVAQTLRPAFEEIWRAFGFDKCRNFDATGKWMGH